MNGTQSVRDQDCLFKVLWHSKLSKSQDSGFVGFFSELCCFVKNPLLSVFPQTCRATFSNSSTSKSDQHNLPSDNAFDNFRQSCWRFLWILLVNNDQFKIRLKKTTGKSTIRIIFLKKRVSSFISRRSGLTINDDNVDKVQALQKLQIFFGKIWLDGQMFQS